MQTNANIIRLFNENVKGKKEPAKGAGHDGVIGHWLEEQFGIKRNGNNAPDIDGYELKKTSPVISFGDWSADYYLFRGRRPKCTQTEFMQMFGKYNDQKQRYSWSGEVIPRFGSWNLTGQKLYIDLSHNVYVIYSWDHDRRDNKPQIVPDKFRAEPIVLACWKAKSLKKKVESKFNVNGWFTCLKDDSGKFLEIGFGDPFTYEDFLDFIRKGDAYFDSGMHEGNPRLYSQWRAKKSFWHNRIVFRMS